MKRDDEFKSVEFTREELAENQRYEEIFGDPPFVFTPSQVEVLEAVADHRDRVARVEWAELLLDMARMFEPNPIFRKINRRVSKSDRRLQKNAEAAAKHLRGEK